MSGKIKEMCFDFCPAALKRAYVLSCIWSFKSVCFMETREMNSVIFEDGTGGLPQHCNNEEFLYFVYLHTKLQL